MRPSAEHLERFEDLTERLSALTQTALYRACSAFGLTPTQYFALAALHSLGNPKMSQLATYLGLTPGACTTLVDRLVRQGWVERCSDPQDRRAVCIHASRMGAEAYAAVSGMRRKMTQEVYKGLDPEAREHVRRSFETLIDAWQQYLRSSDEH